MKKISDKKGTIITFYSYKGGVGRSMCLANAAVMLANWGYRTLIIDWDLEAPGLENFFKDFLDLPKVKIKPGLIDLLTAPSKEVTGSANWRDCLVPVNISGSSSGIKFRDKLFLITSGKVDDEYYRRVRGFDFTEFYQDHNGGQIIEQYRGQWKDEFDFILVDSRTGVTDIGGVCTIQLPDMLVLLFTATNAGFDGVRQVAARAAEGRKQLPEKRIRLLNLPIPTRMDTTEAKLNSEWIQKFRKGLEELYAPWLPDKVDRTEFLLSTKVPYSPFYSFGEGLPVLDADVKDPARSGYAYEAIAGLVAKQLKDAGTLINNRGDFLASAADPELDLSYLEEKEAVYELGRGLRTREENLNRTLREVKVQASKQKSWQWVTYLSVGITILSLAVAAYFYFKNKTKDDPKQSTKDAMILLGLKDSVNKLDKETPLPLKLSEPYEKFAGMGKPVGIDISRLNLVTNWDTLKNTGISFVLLQATSGDHYQDSMFTNNWENAGNHGLIRGAYHYFSPKVDPDTQAVNYFRTVRLKKGDLPPIVDLHGVSSAASIKPIAELLQRLEVHYHAKPIVYATYVTAKLLGTDPLLTSYPLWIGVFGNNNRPAAGPLLYSPQLPKGWTNWTFWQFTTEGTMPSVLNGKTKVDLNQFNGGQTELDKLRIK